MSITARIIVGSTVHLDETLFSQSELPVLMAYSGIIEEIQAIGAVGRSRVSRPKRSLLRLKIRLDFHSMVSEERDTMKTAEQPAELPGLDEVRAAADTL